MAADGHRPPDRRGSWWHCAIPGRGGAPDRLVVVESGRYPDGMLVELAEDMARTQIGDAAVCIVTYGEMQRVVRLQVTARMAPKAPPLWFVELRESTARPPAVSLLAFTGHGQPDGALADESDVSNTEVTGSDQLAALRWYPATGEVDQVYVQPSWRRRSIASALIAAGGSLAVARGWPHLWGDGQRTQLGEHLRTGSRWQHRAAELTHLAPPMTPGEA